MRETASEETRAREGETALAGETPPEAPKRPRESRAAKIRDGIEAVLFSSPRPVSELDLGTVLEATPEAVSEALAALAADAEVGSRGIRLERVGGGWRYVTRPEFDSLLRRFHEVSERSRLSLAALETLAIIAYRQPITLPEVQEIRGVNSASVLKTLFEKKLITTAGKKAVVGTPFFYKTTPDFLVRFGLNELEELPRPEEIEEDLAATVPEDSPPERRSPTALDFRPSAAQEERESANDGAEETDGENRPADSHAGAGSGVAPALDSDADEYDEEDDDEEDDEDEDDDQEDEE